MPRLLNDNEILKVIELKKYYPITKGFIRKSVGEVRALDGISFALKKGETMGLVGESGSGKTTAARSIIRAIEPTDGQIIYRDQDDRIVDLAKMSFSELKKVRSDIQMIFQDPFSSLNPRMTVLDIIAEPLKIRKWSRRAYEARVEELLGLVGLDSRFMRRYPHAFSGGQRQRIGIARALALEPALVLADEPVSALDVSVQAQVLNLLHELKERMHLTLIFVAHDLSVIRYICSRVAVMYLGKFVEIAKTDELFSNPRHPYTSSLLEAVPVPDPDLDWNPDKFMGELPDPTEIITGCNFASRCPYVQDICREESPDLIGINNDHQVSCHRHKELNLSGIN